MLGLKGIRVEAPEMIGDAWGQVLLSDRPAVLDVVTDPNVPIISPHIRMNQIMDFTKAMAKGDPDKAGFMQQSFQDILKEYLPV